MAKFNIDIVVSGGEFRIWKIEPFLEFTGFSTFFSTSFVQGCKKFVKQKKGLQMATTLGHNKKKDSNNPFMTSAIAVF